MNTSESVQFRESHCVHIIFQTGTCFLLYITKLLLYFISSLLTGNMVFNIFRGPIELLMGLVFGSLVGAVCWFLPSKTEVKLTLFTYFS